MMVISIITILAGLLPSLTKATEQARSIQCQNNIEQIPLTMSTHANDHNQCLRSPTCNTPWVKMEGTRQSGEDVTLSLKQVR
jgi:competence protein ComGC